MYNDTLIEQIETLSHRLVRFRTNLETVRQLSETRPTPLPQTFFETMAGLARQIEVHLNREQTDAGHKRMSNAEAVLAQAWSRVLQ